MRYDAVWCDMVRYGATWCDGPSRLAALIPTPHTPPHHTFVPEANANIPTHSTPPHLTSPHLTPPHLTSP
eukprot:CAMPEP_0182564452 /NCGR_PEP_ID=MMETSP1324-20130603/6401_1 /TAXON_ID=236786 /ORGANISM="Florenciella sp., Strain RCC1587" /LENGTH=69 /DNA_ID=CAMNT_0024777921 /DNA_START=80 /DNA_END=286 /DNA_ORIENTATION=+